MEPLNTNKVKYTVNDGWCETEWDDGMKLQALPNMDTESIERAHKLGYPGTDKEAVWSMTMEHDLLHSILATAQGHNYSLSLRTAAKNQAVRLGSTTNRKIEQEEALVLCVQFLLNHVRKTGELLTDSYVK